MDSNSKTKAIRKCMKNKVIRQVSGTCWFNTIVNILLLSECTRNLIKKEWDALTLLEKRIICGDKYCVIDDACPTIEGKEFIRKRILQMYYHLFVVNSSTFSSRTRRQDVMLKPALTVKEETYKRTERDKYKPVKESKVVTGSSVDYHTLKSTLSALFKVVKLGKDIAIQKGTDDFSSPKRESASSSSKSSNTPIVLDTTLIVVATEADFPKLAVLSSKHVQSISISFSKFFSDAGHAIAGCTCRQGTKDTRYIYDSNYDEPIYCDWKSQRFLKNPLKMLDTIYFKKMDLEKFRSYMYIFDLCKNTKNILAYKYEYCKKVLHDKKEEYEEYEEDEEDEGIIEELTSELKDFEKSIVEYNKFTTKSLGQTHVNRTFLARSILLKFFSTLMRTPETPFDFVSSIMMYKPADSKVFIENFIRRLYKSIIDPEWGSLEDLEKTFKLEHGIIMEYIIDMMKDLIQLLGESTQVMSISCTINDYST
jgi:hypothetical protein